MPEPGTLLVFMAAALALNLTPGPDMLYVTARSVSDGRAAGVLLGLAFNVQGTLVNVAVALLASRTTRWLRASRRGVSLLQRLTGAVFVILGARIAVAAHR